MSEFRQNPITKNWVLIAPARGKRPDEYKTYSVMLGVPEVDQTCVFCPGSENNNIELLRFPQGEDWEIRIIPNKFAALDKTAVYRHKEFYVSHSGDGDHEVIITRKHNEPVALQSIATVELSIRTFIERINNLSKNPSLAYVQIFHNHGRDAGASILHPHYQLLATPIVPPHIHSEILGCYHYYENNRSCIYCDIIKEEVAVKERVVHESEHFIVISAYASRCPFETWILPKKHGARFEEMSEDEIKHLSFVLKVTLGQLYTKLSDPPLNFYIHNMPIKRDNPHAAHEEKAFHWHLTIFPRITIWAGFEFATGIPVNPMPPEVTAKFLRGEG
jgi:UDPglucose--hexose-1-phosphate uridylyltransferase